MPVHTIFCVRRRGKPAARYKVVAMGIIKFSMLPGTKDTYGILERRALGAHAHTPWHSLSITWRILQDAPAATNSTLFFDPRCFES